MLKPDYFSQFVGLEGTKRKLSYFLDNHKESQIIPHIFLVAEKGGGKTTLSRTIAQNLKLVGQDIHKPFIEINCSTLGGAAHFYQQIVIPNMIDKEMTLIFDEASEISRDLSMALLTILNPNSENRNTFTVNSQTVEFDFKKHSFIFATTEPQKVYDALVDRLELIQLEDYTTENLAQILVGNLVGIFLEEGLVFEIAQVLRGNPRGAVKMANNIKIHAHAKNSFTWEDWRLFKHSLNIHPLGLNNIELRILKILGANNEVSLTNLSSQVGLKRETIQHSIESFLLRNNLFEVAGRGRKITTKGQKYLQDLENWGLTKT